jgi:hypothetical protein
LGSCSPDGKAEQSRTACVSKDFAIFGNWNFINFVEETADGGFILTGKTLVDGAEPDVHLYKTDNAGTLQWARTFGTPVSEDGFTVHQTDDKGYVVIGNRGDTFVPYDSYLLKTDSTGTLSWPHHIGSFGEDDRATAMLMTPDKGFLIAGAGRLYKTDQNGITGCNEQLTVTTKVDTPLIVQHPQNINGPVVRDIFYACCQYDRFRLRPANPLLEPRRKTCGFRSCKSLSIPKSCLRLFHGVSS